MCTFNYSFEITKENKVVLFTCIQNWYQFSVTPSKLIEESPSIFHNTLSLLYLCFYSSDLQLAGRDQIWLATGNRWNHSDPRRMLRLVSWFHYQKPLHQGYLPPELCRSQTVQSGQRGVVWKCTATRRRCRAWSHPCVAWMGRHMETIICG